MISDSVANASIPSAALSSKDLGKKKRARTAKLKQCKLDVRREQWLSQGTAKNKCCKEESSGVRMGNIKENNHPLGNLEMRPRGEESGGGSRSVINHNDSDSESLSNSPTSLTGSISGGNDSWTNFTGSSSSSSSSSRHSGGCCSGSITEEEVGEDDDGCLDDWEAVADALAAKDKQESQFSESSLEQEPIPPVASPGQATDGGSGSAGNSKPETTRTVPRSSGSNSRAWRPDDAFRPQSLPNLSKQLSLPNSDRQHYGCGGVPWACSNIMPPPSSCPICTEDLDSTDSSFLPCLCGFRLCLFCYKRIIEDGGRCPGCRKPYELNPVEADVGMRGGSLTFRLARSCSMVTRS